MPKALPQASESAHTDANQQFSMIGVQGTLGTSDVTGSAPTIPFGGNPLTGAQYVELIAGTLNVGTVTSTLTLNTGTITTIIAGTQNTLGTVGNLNNGSVNVLSGTLQSSGTTTGVGVVTALTNGSVNILTGTIQNSGNGTIVGGTLNNLATGTLNALASGTITGGTIQNIAGGTVISPMPSGTLNIGTVSVTIGTVGGGAANAAAASGNPNPVGGTDSGGTIRTILVDSAGVQRSTGTSVMSIGTLTTGTLQNLVTGTINALAAGTITGGTLQNLNAGTITALATGTITGGTLGNLNYGTLTIDPKPGTVGTYYGTQGTTGAAVWGTLVPSVGNGNKVYVSGLSIVVTSGTVEVVIANNVAGSVGTGVLSRGQYPAGGGIVRDYVVPRQTGTGGTIAYWLGGAGTVDMILDYWVGA